MIVNGDSKTMHIQHDGLKYCGKCRTSNGKVPIYLKMTLTTTEAAEYSNNRQYAAFSKLPILAFCGQQEIGEAQRV